MTMRISAILLVTGLVTGPLLLAQAVFHDSRSPQVSFAAAEIVRARGSKRAMPDRAIRDLSSDTSSLRFAIAADAAESKVLAEALRVAPLKTAVPQSYAIRRAETAGRVTIAVLGSDPAAAMYGGLDIAEALRPGPVANIANSDHLPHIAQRGILGRIAAVGIGRSPHPMREVITSIAEDSRHNLWFLAARPFADEGPHRPLDEIPPAERLTLADEKYGCDS
jgi:hypothetical protein